MKKKTARKSSSATKRTKRTSLPSFESLQIVIYSFFSVLVFLVIAGVMFGQKTEKITTCANSISCIKDLSGKFDPTTTEGVFLGKTVPVKNTIALDPNIKRFVLGDSTVEKKIYVDLGNQMLYANEGDQTVFSFPVSTGKWGRTPTGTFHIWIKLRYTRMSGGAGADYYNLPNVPYTMFFYNDEVSKGMGYSIHGAYWHNNFGHPMSHGCVNMRTEDVEKIYNWANPTTMGATTYATKENPGTDVIIYGTPPAE